MLLGRMPGEFGPTHFSTALPPYAALLTQYLDRFGPYRLQPYALPPISPPPTYPRPPVPAPSVMRPLPNITIRRPTVIHEPRGNGPGLHSSRMSSVSPTSRGIEARSRGSKGPSAERGPKGGRGTEAKPQGPKGPSAGRGPKGG